MPTNSPLLEWWFSALHEPVGIILMTTDRHRLMNQLYAARQQHDNPEELMGLSICLSPTAENELWIVHKIVKMENADAEE
jgi:hypothetical protein